MIRDYLDVREHPANIWARMWKHDKYVLLLIDGPLWQLLDSIFPRHAPVFKVPIPVDFTQTKDAGIAEMVEASSETWTREKFLQEGYLEVQVGFLCK